ncbi:hypothetical protein M409DRAFT_60230 [Zasmidium cellare ATCC 36951]|uniref:Methyltransferase domain-containing protein n=1 Tax=Zasmidium cellare ATCC 36951 TaxID=1080233 RepID=A0A6A6C1T6_ZASCE|nr:uncharacterized protein M409DRAFT_60230 [Zasmidium cellare ATCC 36951]KAF2160120.1 hypothetical protein M409DRAFT_60230 [Zasmidium cellare ATCC 36951]
MASNPPEYNSQGWSGTAALYREKVNNVTNKPAALAVDNAAAIKPIDKTSHVIDVASGAGVVTQHVAETYAGAKITAIDSAQQMLDVIQVPAGTSLERKLLDAGELSQAFPAGTFSHAICTFALHVVPDSMKVIREMRKVLQPDGVIAIAVWGQRMDNNATFLQAAQSIDPTYQLPPQMGPTHGWRTPETLREKLEEAGFRDMQTTDEMLMPFGFANAEEWTRFVFEGKHPVEELKLRTWTRDLEALRRAELRVTREDFDDARGMMASSVVAVARV